MAELNLVEASIEDLQSALSSRHLTSVDLVARYLRRISAYDCRSVSLNSIPLLNPDVFAEAEASDDRRASGAINRRLEGIPFTAKDSYKVKGMSVASGSPAFKDLIANDDAFTVDMIRAAGGVLMGKTNMPSMAYGGMQRGIYGRAESPYNPRFLAAAFASGSSNGSAVSTAASFAAFGMGEETVSSGRSPASNNALVAYTPSRGWISIRGNWPLYPTCDVVVPHTRSMEDMLTLLEVIAAEDPISDGDFWRSQPFIKLEKPWPEGPASIRTIAGSKSLSGVRIAVPEMYVGGSAPVGARPVTTSPEVIDLWVQAREELEALGAEVILVPDFPAVTGYENPELLPEGSPRLPDQWHWTERGPLVAHGWNGFLIANKDPNVPGIASVDENNIYPDSLRTSAELKQMDRANLIHWNKLASYTKNSTMWEIPNLEVALKALEGMRKTLLDDYLASHGCDCFAFPAAGDVGAEDADVNDTSAAYAWRNGVFYSNGNRAVRHLGIPTVTVPMGLLRNKKMPVGLTFAGRAYDDVNLLKYANAFNAKAQRRVPPPLTPELDSDRIPLTQQAIDSVTSHSAENETSLYQITIKGIITSNAEVNLGERDIAADITISVDSHDIPTGQIKLGPVTSRENGSHSITFEAWAQCNKPAEKDARTRTVVPVALDKIVVVILARWAPGGYPSGWLGMIDWQ
ncbi:amidase signature domain-containing protein [Xylariales sp. PMI_506]|nr:amidase signature domain-containing protein [Xylariales sp. PMI_506]